MSTTSPVRSQRPAHGRTPVRLGLTATWLPAAVVVATRVIWAAELPDRVATHWRGSARPDGISSTSGMFAAVLTVTVAAAIVATAAICLRHRVPAVASAGILIGPLVAAPIAASWSISIWATLAAGSAEDATLGPRGLLVVPALVLGLVPIALLWQRTARPGPQVPTAALDLAPAERASWSTVLGGRVFVVTAALLVAAAVLVGVTVTLWSGGIVAAAAVVTAAFGRIDVTADRRGLRLRSSLLGIPFKRIPLADIAAARSERIDPMQWGGWGYRVTPGRAALVLHPGPGLVVERRSGAVFAVTLADPDTPARLLTALTRATQRTD